MSDISATHVCATLAVQNLFKSYETGTQLVPVLSGISCTFEQGKSYALCGVSGSGKSTLLSILAGFEPPTQGDILWNGVSRAQWLLRDTQQFLHAGIGMLFQRPYLMRELTVFENTTVKGWSRPESRALVEERAGELLDRVGLAHVRDRYPYELSGGEQLRVALVRALAYPPQFLIADEPTAHLDATTALSVVNLIFDEAARSGCGLIIATHDPTVSSRCQTRYTLNSGILLGAP